MQWQATEAQQRLTLILLDNTGTTVNSLTARKAKLILRLKQLKGHLVTGRG